jgi:hypothetical protein
MMCRIIPILYSDLFLSEKNSGRGLEPILACLLQLKEKLQSRAQNVNVKN